MILKNLLGRKTRTALTVFGIMVGVAAVVALGALADGFIQGYGAMSGGSGADLLVTQAEAIDLIFSGVDQNLEPQLRGLSGVVDLSKMVYAFAATEGAPYFIVYGYDPDEFAIQKFKVIAGEPLPDRASGRGGPPLLLGRAAAEDLDKTVGDTFRLYETTYRVVGIYETGEPFEDGAVVISLEAAQSISGKPRQVNAFLIKVRDGADIEALRNRIETRFEDLTVSTSAKFADEQDLLQYVYVYTWGVSLIAIIIGGVGVMNTMLMSVSERTREFGVLRAVGWRPGQVLGMVLGESLVLSVVGGFLGVGLGVLSIRSLENVPVISSMFPAQLSPL
ncbi:MAG: ABC transporter permease, partial [Anaerolineae bacterium]|nr:ABC transporter permease [Anaerolineae bacterium]